MDKFIFLGVNALIVAILLAVGCDGVVGSGLKNDHCGVCGGDNESCRIIAGIYTRRTLKYGYNQITRIPAGSCHVNITELERSRNYLVLKYSNGTGVINDDRTRMKRPGTYLAAGTMFTYNKYAGDKCPGECLYAPGPLTSDMDIQLLTYRRNPGIKYMFTIPKDKIDSVMQSLAPSGNTATRHQGRNQGESQASSTSSINSNNRNGNQGRRISYDQKPQFVSPDTVGSPYKSYQALESGPHGTQEAINRYRQSYGGDVNNRNNLPDRTNNVAAFSNRNNLPLSNRQTETRYQTNSIPDTGYQGSVYSRGSSNQIYDRTNSRTGTAYQQNYGNRIENRRPELIVPNTIDEVNFHWTISGFTECSTSCGGGTQDTIVVCMKRKLNIIVTDENCDPNKKKVQTISCNRSPCPPDWDAGPWSVCSKTCGQGVQTRKVECQQRYSQNYSVPTSAGQCNLVAKPDTSRGCEVRPCADWRATNWTQCSVECGIGQVSRDVDCVNTEGEVVPDRECSGLEPVSTKSCDMGTCAKGWFQTSWSKECSSECGRGYHTRNVYCSAEDGSPLPEHKCGQKPKTRKSCKKKRPCGGFWFEGPWSKCTATCGSSVQTRDVVCMKKLERNMIAVVGAENCKEHPKPETQKPCPTLPDCPAMWFMTKWSQCSKSCGVGIKTRDVKCLDTGMTPSAECRKQNKPSLRRTCNTQDCDLPQLDEDPGCKDNWSQCHMVVQARLCPYKYYKEQCCVACKLHHLKHQKQKEEQEAEKQQQQEVGKEQQQQQQQETEGA
ncbi:thrombospondin type-1 domain-containing protein 4-like isoform X2 [Ruditapes philippinarum]|uniref:thrombospondin type-1 domain-containing protein 4-like isoform X2 n=1 Tax=Ruditapes philippinarum TaxID=129788 RepID=UPI00295AB1F6|nr:thrombospondin type-1 domain-containing protein 4-like isoform X2 [Ruditapes philippinarum]XP_060551940.1 thrombospondin type-1 domain-containing protein 4-like isoform X2 [Ruditapes philippinarum]